MVKHMRTGILIANLGTPDAPTPRAVRRFLAEMLSDRRIVELPRLLWLPILHGVVLRVRPRRTAASYRKIWTEEGSPQLAIARRIERALRSEVAGRISEFAGLELGMTYRLPRISEALRRLRDPRADRILVLPLFPQYSGATTAAVFDQVTRELQTWRSIPEVRFINEYHLAPGYLAALEASIREYWRDNGRGGHLLMSFHSLPKRSVALGDPYLAQCEATSQRIAATLGLGEQEWSISFQSRFGYQEWLRPYTADHLAQLARRGVRRLDVVCPGFSVDCLESLEEIAIRGQEQFEAAGGERLRYIPALNDRADHVAFLADLVERHCRGWNDSAPGRDERADAPAIRPGRPLTA
jgi:ferrochelatase